MIGIGVVFRGCFEVVILDFSGDIGAEVDVAVSVNAKVSDEGGGVNDGVGGWSRDGLFVGGRGFVLVDDFENTGDGTVALVVGE